MILFTDLMPPSPPATDKQHKTPANLYGVPLHCVFHHVVTNSDRHEQRGIHLIWHVKRRLRDYRKAADILEQSQLLLQHAALIETKLPYNQPLDPNLCAISPQYHSFPGGEIADC